VDSRAGYERAVADLAHLHTTAPRVTACDKHPGYFTTRYAADSGLHTVPVQHHVAHVLAALAEHGSCGPALGIAWDGTGYGEDGSVWGGEFLHVDGSRYRRVAHFRTFRLPGGERAIREPRRSALGVLFELFGAGAFERTELAPVAAFTATERRVLHRALAREVNAPRTSSVGRLFDAVSALLGLCERSSYEGEAASMLEWALVRQPGRKPLRSRGYEFVLTLPAGGGDMPSIVDWAPAIERLIADASRGRSAAAVSAAFHAGLVESILAVASAVGEPTVVLTGGCFQNAHLCEAAVGALRRAGFTPLWHERVPPNDGGLALGQALFASLTERGD
jgi:hydrogenase maturation protein HypF